MPAPVESRDDLATGRTSAVGLVTWLTTQPGPRRDGAPGWRRRLVRAVDREGEARPRPARRPAPLRPHRVDRRVVLVVGGQQLVARLEPQRRQDGVDAGGRVRDEGEAVRVGAEEGARPVRAASSCPSSSPPRKRTGSASSRSRARAGPPARGAGQAPNEPWLRKVTSGSNGQPRSDRYGERCDTEVGRKGPRRIPGRPTLCEGPGAPQLPPMSMTKSADPRGRHQVRPRPAPATVQGSPGRADHEHPLVQAEPREERSISVHSPRAPRPRA